MLQVAASWFELKIEFVSDRMNRFKLNILKGIYEFQQLKTNKFAVVSYFKVGLKARKRQCRHL